jgi:hypothetical protein
LPVANLIGPWIARGWVSAQGNEILFLAHRIPFRPTGGQDPLASCAARSGGAGAGACRLLCR